MSAVGDWLASLGLRRRLVGRQAGCPSGRPTPLFERIADTQLVARAARGVRRLRVEPAPRRRPDATDDRAARARRAQGMRSLLALLVRGVPAPGVEPRAHRRRRSRIIDDHHLADALATGRGVVVALPHMGNWDHAGAWATLAHSPVVTVAERLKPEDLYEQFLAFRRGARHGHHPADRRRRRCSRTCRRSCASGASSPCSATATCRTAASRCSSSAPRRGCRPGRPRWPVDTGAVLAHRRSSTSRTAATACGSTRRSRCPPEGERSRARSAATTQLVADQLRGRHRARTPTDWHMLQRLWVDDLDPTRRPRPRRAVKVGIVCPYDWSSPGGVQAHVRDLAVALQLLGHEVSVLAPVRRGRPSCRRTSCPAGGAVAVPYNGSVARSPSGPVDHAGCGAGSARASSTCCTSTSRCRRACRSCRAGPRAGPIVATWHSVDAALPGPGGRCTPLGADRAGEVSARGSP